MNRRRPHHWLAAALALLGQVTLTFGLPLPTPARPARTDAPAEALSPCGCNAAERAAGKCCCSRPHPASPTARAAEESPAEPQAPCCAAHRPSPKKQATSAVKVRWAGGVLTQRCLGPVTTAFGLSVPACMPPADTGAWVHDESPCGWTVSEHFALTTVAVAPVAPPPR